MNLIIIAKQYIGMLCLGGIIFLSPLQLLAQRDQKARSEKTRNGQSTVQKNTTKPNVGRVERSQVTYRKEKTKVPAVRSLPPSSRQVVYNNTTYHYNNGKYYTNYGGKYIQVEPKAGLRIGVLPSGSTSFTFGKGKYFFFEGVFYTGAKDGYQVVEAQEGMVVEALPAGYEKVEINGVLYYEFDNVLYQKVDTVNGKAYQVVGTVN